MAKENKNQYNQVQKLFHPKKMGEKKKITKMRQCKIAKTAKGICHIIVRCFKQKYHSGATQLSGRPNIQISISPVNIFVYEALS